ncbi:MAG: hypothetical protein LBL01_07470 [Bifidobacteriaceae bacterium]|jgi:hypothetical protein|nr:hypothetical protein [Bifidobacteriaceae bacterium]
MAGFGRERGMSPDELRQKIRTRLVSSLSGGLDDYPYARRPFAGVGQILCVDYPESVTALTGDLPQRLALPVDELFAQGQANVDAEPAGPPGPLADTGLMLISGESSFVASKAANLAALVPQVTGPAPHGLVFCVPRHQALVYGVVGPGWVETVNYLARLAAAQARRAAAEGDMVSPLGYYRSPDGAVETLSGPSADESAEDGIRVTPEQAFQRHVMGTVPPAA